MDEKRARIGKKWFHSLLMSFSIYAAVCNWNAFFVCVHTAGNIEAKDKKQQQKKMKCETF